MTIADIDFKKILWNAAEELSGAVSENNYKIIDGFCKSSTIEDVKAQDYQLTPGIYVGVEAAEEDDEPFG